MNRIDIPKEQLEEFYIKQKLSVEKTAKALGRNYYFVQKRLRQYGLIRSHIWKQNGNKYNITAEELRNYYIKEEMSTDDLIQLYKCCRGTIDYYIAKYGIQMRSRGEATKIAVRKGKKSYLKGNKFNFKGEKRKDRAGYVYVYAPNHPTAYKSENRRGYVREHLLVWERSHGYYLPKGWIIHHLNGIKDDNREENLVAMLNGEHSALAKPYKARIRQLEKQVEQLELENRKLHLSLFERQFKDIVL